MLLAREGIFANGAATAAFSSLVASAASSAANKHTKPIPEAPKDIVAEFDHDTTIETKTRPLAAADETLMIVEEPPSVRTVPDAGLGDAPTAGSNCSTTASCANADVVAASARRVQIAAAQREGALAGNYQALVRDVNAIQNTAPCLVLCAAAPGSAAISAGTNAAYDYFIGGNEITLSSVALDGAAGAALSPLGFAPRTGYHPASIATDTIRTTSIGVGVEAAFAY